MRRRHVLLAGTGLGLLAWGIVEARLTYGAVPTRLTVIFDGT